MHVRSISDSRRDQAQNRDKKLDYRYIRNPDSLDAIKKAPRTCWRFGRRLRDLADGAPEQYRPDSLRLALERSSNIFINFCSTMADLGRTDGFFPVGDPKDAQLPPHLTLIEAPRTTAGRWETIFKIFAPHAKIWRCASDTGGQFVGWDLKTTRLIPNALILNGRFECQEVTR